MPSRKYAPTATFGNKTILYIDKQHIVKQAVPHFWELNHEKNYGTVLQLQTKRATISGSPLYILFKLANC